MDKHTIKSTINELLNLLDEKTFFKLLNVKNLDCYVKKLTAYKFLQLFIIAQLNETASLKLIAKELKNTEELQVFLKMDAISKSQLSRKQSCLPPKVFETIFRLLVPSILAKMKHSTPILREITKLLVIDSSTMSMSLSQYPWATFGQTKAGVRLHLHVVVTKELTIPDQAVILPAKHADRSQMNALVEVDSDAFTYLIVATRTISSMTNFVSNAIPLLHA